MTPACVRSRLAEQLPGPRRHEREAVDLAVRVVQRDADLLALVLEAVHLPDPVHRAEHGRAICPGLHYRARAARRQVGEGGVMISGEADDLASPDRRPPRLRRAERALLLRRQEGPALPLSGYHHPFADERVTA